MKYLLSTFGLLSLCLLLTIGCASKQPENIKSEKRCLTDSMKKLIAIDTVHIEQVENELKLNAKVSFNEDKVVRIFPLVNGNVLEVQAELGDFVQKGQTLVVIRSPEIAELEEKLEAARAAVSTAEKSFKTVQELVQSRLSSERELQAVQSEAQRARAELHRVEETMRIYGASNSQSMQTLKSPCSCYIVGKKVTEGMQVRTSDAEPMLVLSELKEVWVMANVFESDISRLKAGYPVEISTLSYPDTIFTGTIDKVYNVLDPETHTMKVRIRLA